MLIPSTMALTRSGRLFRTTCLLLAAAAVVTAAGCAGTTADEPQGVASAGSVTSDRYAAAFDVARDVLRDNRFQLDRVDAAAGVITTQRSNGARDAVDVLQRRQRYAIVSFAPAGSPAGTMASADADLRDGSAPLDVSVKVIIERIEVPGWRLPGSSIRLSSHSVDPDKVKAELEPLYAVPVGEDADLAAELAGQIREKLGR